jgi:hypothetical protein
MLTSEPEPPPFEPAPDPHPETWRPVSTGPLSAAGKTISSMNRLTHGCRSLKTILRHEDPAEYAALIAGWLKHYNPQDVVERGLVEETAHAKWFLMRSQRWLDDVEFQMNMNAYLWTDTQQHQHSLSLRYKTSAERSFLRLFKELEAYFARQDRKLRKQAETPDKHQPKPSELERSAQPEPLESQSPARPAGLAPVPPSPADSAGPVLGLEILPIAPQWVTMNDK